MHGAAPYEDAAGPPGLIAELRALAGTARALHDRAAAGERDRELAAAMRSLAAALGEYQFAVRQAFAAGAATGQARAVPGPRRGRRSLELVR